MTPRRARAPRTLAAACGGLLLAALLPRAALAEDPFAAYRELFGDDNPAELAVSKGQELWNTARGPRQATLAACDLGLGPGVVEGAYAALPRYFPDVGAVMDLESRLLHCMATIQGFPADALALRAFSQRGEPQTDLEVLTAYAASLSRGRGIEVPQRAREEQDAFARGRRLFYRRAGPYDFSCASCHGADGLRIRLQQLPNLTVAEGGRSAFSHWPAYRISQGAVRTMQWRMADCVRQQRLPELIFGSQASVDLITYLGVLARGGLMDAPSLRR
jgi:L-cysteine S-thiosulfotransferase